jgi:hypothetical protein
MKIQIVCRQQITPVEGINVQHLLYIKQYNKL